MEHIRPRFSNDKQIYVCYHHKNSVLRKTHVIKKLLIPLIGAACLSSSIAFASPYGFNISALLIGKDPNNLHAYRASFLYEPPSWTWKHFQVFIDTSYGHWWVGGNTIYKSLSIYSIAPVLRFYFVNSDYISPFADISIGPSYVTKTRFADRNLGEHFSFQDQVGIGASFGQKKNLSLGLSIIHYSNGSLCAMNAGITAPLMLNVSYRF